MAKKKTVPMKPKVAPKKGKKTARPKGKMA